MNPITYLFTPAFCKADMLLDCLENIDRDLELREEKKSGAVRHIVIDQHYPNS